MPLLDQSWINQISSMLFFLALIMLYPRYMLYKMITELETTARTLEGYTGDAVKIIEKTSQEKGGGGKEIKKEIENALEFFLISPVSLDPYGILKKIEYILDETEGRFESIAESISPRTDHVWKANTISLLKAGIGINNIAKIVRHYVEFVKKTKNSFLAMSIQMSLPLIKKVAKAQMEGIKAIAEGKPIGDGIGPLVAANLIKEERHSEIAKNIICHEGEISGVRAFIVKADGPGANLGKFGDAVEKLCKKNKIAKVITVDASLKLEGEKTGKVAEGIGAAIGDPGPEKAKIEDAAMKSGIPLEAYAVKMSLEEAISPMTEEIGSAVGDAMEFIKKSVERAKNGNVIVVGVGNTCGVANSYSAVKDLKLPKKKEDEEEETLQDKLMKLMVKEPREERKN